MTCQQCGATLKEGAKFCTACGHPLKQQDNATEHVETNETPITQPNEIAATADPGGAVPPSAPDPQGESSNWKEHKVVKETVEISKNYWSSFKQSITHPAKHSLETNRANMINGIITIGLLSLFIAGIFYNTKGTITSIAISFFDFSHSFKPAFFPDFVRPFIVFVLLNGIIAGSIFLACKFMRSSSNPSIFDIIARFGAFLTIPAIIFLLAFLFGILGSYSLVLYLSLLGLLSIGTAISLTIFSYKNQEGGGLDPLYGILAAYAISGIGYMILNQLFY